MLGGRELFRPESNLCVFEPLHIEPCVDQQPVLRAVWGLQSIVQCDEYLQCLTGLCG